MRELFYSFNELLGYYQYLKFDVSSCGTILPSMDFECTMKFSALAAKSTQEEKFCFICDVENYVKFYHTIQPGHFHVPVDCLQMIFTSAFCPHFRHKTFGQLVKHFKARIANGERIPRRVTHVSHISDIARDMRNGADAYFIARGYLSVTKNVTVFSAMN